MYVSNDLENWIEIGNPIAVSNAWEQPIDVGFNSGGFLYIAVCGYDSSSPLGLFIDDADPVIYSSTQFTLTVQSIDDGTGWSVPTNVYIDGNCVGQIDGSGAFSVSPGVHTVGVDDNIPIPGYPDMYWFFNYFDTGTGGNPTTIDVTNDMTITAHYDNGYG